MIRSVLPALMLSGVLVLAGCESAEDKAEGYYQSALTLMEEGDVDRALIELRNVFEFDGFHQEARRLYADTLAEQGNLSDAYSHYLLLIEQYPDTLDVRITLSELAIGRGDWPEVERHGIAAQELAPDNISVRAITNMLAYREAVQDPDEDAQAEALAEARAILEASPDNILARQIVIDSLARSRTPTAAIPEIDIMLAQRPDVLRYHVQKFQILVRAERQEEAGEALETMYALFPEDKDVRTTLIQWYVAQGDTERTEALLRDLAGDVTGDTTGHANVVQFLQTTYGVDAARAELTDLIAANEGTANAELYRAMDAVISFGEGEQDAAITQMQDIIEGADPSDQTRRIKMLLTQMLSETQDIVGARALVEEVIAEEPGNVDALKVRARWKIDDDDPDGAIIDLRVALNQSPRDAEILTLMAAAHQRAGQPALAGERLSLAVDVSNYEPSIALRYARFLLSDGQQVSAIEVLRNAQRVAPTNIDILSTLSEIHLDRGDWGALDTMQITLQEINTVEALNLANSLSAAVLLRQDRTEEGIQLLQEQLDTSDSSTSAAVTIILTQLRSGRLEQARDFLNEALQDNPDEPALRLLSGSILAMEGDTDEAEAVFRGVMADQPGVEGPTRLLYRLLMALGRGDDAMAALNETIAVNPQARQLLWIKASVLEREGDVEGAIAIYEDLYDDNTSDVIVANNLASLLATHSDDPDDLERAYQISRRLANVPVPQFQDTYGWLQYLQGNYAEAVASLEPAAEALPTDATVQFHLGMTYAALDRPQDAIAFLTRAVQLGADSDLPFLPIARETLESLQTPE